MHSNSHSVHAHVYAYSAYANFVIDLKRICVKCDTVNSITPKHTPNTGQQIPTPQTIPSNIAGWVVDRASRVYSRQFCPNYTHTHIVTHTHTYLYERGNRDVNLHTDELGAVFFVSFREKNTVRLIKVTADRFDVISLREDFINYDDDDDEPPNLTSNENHNFTMYIFCSCVCVCGSLPEVWAFAQLPVSCLRRSTHIIIIKQHTTEWLKRYISYGQRSTPGWTRDVYMLWSSLWCWFDLWDIDCEQFGEVISNAR